MSVLNLVCLPSLRKQDLTYSSVLLSQQQFLSYVISQHTQLSHTLWFIDLFHTSLSQLGTAPTAKLWVSIALIQGVVLKLRQYGMIFIFAACLWFRNSSLWYDGSTAMTNGGPNTLQLKNPGHPGLHHLSSLPILALVWWLFWGFFFVYVAVVLRTTSISYFQLSASHTSVPPGYFHFWPISYGQWSIVYLPQGAGDVHSMI